MNTSTLNSLLALFLKASAQADWKSALNTLVAEFRPFMVFDNIAVYLTDPGGSDLEVAFARAYGRGKTAEAEAAWGNRLAATVLARRQIVVQDPPDSNTPVVDRLKLSHYLGLPLFAGEQILGTVIFIRFGGPEFSEEHVQVAALTSSWISCILERGYWRDTSHQLDEAQHLVSLREDSIATISHELRTPLGFIKGYATTLLRQDTSWDPGTQREFLTIIEEEADRLTHLIEDLLESSRLRSNTSRFKFQPTRIDALIRDVVARVNHRQPGISIGLDFEPVPPIPGDNIQLTRVFENLFSNAIKYAPGSPLEVVLKMMDENLLVSISDHGPGIPVEYQTLIFEQFQRVPDENTPGMGTGLGLYICQQIIMAHHGKIWVESIPGQGATFHIELPLKGDGRAGV